MLRLGLALFILLLGPFMAHGLPGFITFPADVTWRQQSSPHFEAIFREGDEKLAEKVLRIAEHTHKILSPIFPEGPGLTRIVLADFQDSTNGYALTFPYPHIVLFLSPPESISQLTSLDDWLASLILHEYTHILHIYPANGLWKPIQWIFGPIAPPNGLMPSHFHEGMATFFETELTKGGRGRSAAFAMAKRMAVAAGKWNLEDQPIDRFEHTSTIWPMGVSPYFYGFYMTQELWNRKGAKGIYQLTESFSSGWPYLLNDSFREVYGTDYETIWKDVYRKTGEKAKAEIEAIGKTPLSSLKFLTDTKYYVWDVTFSSDGKRVAYRRTRPDDGNRLIIADATSGAPLHELEISAGGTFGLCWGKKEGHELLLYPKVGSEINYSVNSIGGWDVGEGQSISFPGELKHVHLLQCDSALKRIVAYVERATQGKIVELAWEKREEAPKTVREWPLPSGTYVSSILVDNGTWFLLKTGMKTQLYRWEGKEPQVILELPTYAYNLRPGRRPNELLAITTLDGRDEIWALDLTKKEAVKTVGLMSGVNAFDRSGDRYLLSAYRHGGYDLASATALVGDKRKLSEMTRANPVRKIADEGVTLSKAESYSPFSTLYPRTWVPSMLFVPDGAQFGVWIPGFDIGQKNFYDIFGGYDTRGSLFANLSYSYRFGGGHTAGVEGYLLPNYLISAAAFQSQWGGSVFYQGTFSWLPPSIRLGLEYKKIEQSKLGEANQAIGPQIGLTYRTGFKQRPLDISPTKGTQLSLTHAHFFKGIGSDDTYSSTTFGFEQYLAAPWWDRSVWYFAAKAGYTEGNSIFNSYYTAGGELIFSQGRGYFQNRGFAPQTFFARRIANFNLEYRFPISLVERGYSFWPLFLKRIHGALVADMTTFDFGFRHPRDRYTEQPHNIFKTYHFSGGFELKTDWTFGFYLQSQLRLGLYHGFGPYGETLYGTLGFEASI